MYKIGNNITLTTTSDGIEGYISIVFDEDNDRTDLSSYLEDISKIFNFGLKEELLIQLLKSGNPIENILVAEGKLPLSGKDGSIKYHFEINKSLLPKISPDGTVDYKELDSVNLVRKGQLLAEIIPPTEGIDGLSVLGNPIPYTKGKLPKFPKTKNITQSDDGIYLFSGIDGLVEYVNGKISASEILRLENIGNDTGNIQYNGNVIVNRDMLNGFSLKTSGNVEIKGAVEGGYIKCQGDVLVRQGIQGYNRLTIENEGNLCSKFIENSIIKTGQNITAEAIMHSDVSSRSNILVIGKKGLIVGGTCRAKYEIRAKTVGSSMATTTILEVGVDPEVKSKFLELEKKINNSTNNLEKIDQSIKVLEILKRSERIDDKKLALLLELQTARYKILSEIEKDKEDIAYLEVEISSLTKGQIKVADIVYPGVKIVIGNSFLYVRDELRRCTFYREGNDIRIGPY